MTRDRRLRLLFVVPFAAGIGESHGGGRVVAEAIERSATRHDVAVLQIVDADERHDPATFEGRVETVVRHRVRSRGAPRARLLRGLLRGRPVWVSEVASPDAAERLRALCAEWEPDVVRFEYAVSVQWAPAIRDPRVVRVLHEYDPPLQFAREVAERRIGGRLRVLDVVAWRRYEPWALANVDAAVVPTARDREVLSRSARTTPIFDVPFALSVPNEALDPVGGPSPNVLFVGSFAHAPNLDAAWFLVDEIAPRVRARHPDAVFTLVGAEPPHSLASRPDVTVTGRVPDVRPFLGAASVIVAPIRIGGGIRVKVLEALAAGKALVATERAVAGLGVQRGTQVLIGDDAVSLARHVADLLDEPRRRRELGTAARAWATANLDWDVVIDRYDEVYRRLVGRRSAAAPQDHHRDVPA